MSISYVLKIPINGLAKLPEIKKLLKKLSDSEEIDIITSSAEDTVLLFQFFFRKWRILAKGNYADVKNFKSAIPIITPSLKQEEDNVKSQLYEAAKSEILASNLKVNMKVDSEQILFQAIYEPNIPDHQAEQIGIFLQQRLELLFSVIKGDHKFPPFKFLKKGLN